MGGHGGEEGLFCSGLWCLCLSTCVCLGLVSSQSSLPYTFAYTSCFSLTATRPDGFLPSPGPPDQGLLLLMLFGALLPSCPLACAFKHFHIEPLVSISRSALRHQHDLNPTGRQVSVHPFSLTPVGRWLPGVAQFCFLR